MPLSGSRIVLAGTALLVLVAGLLVAWAALRPGPPGPATRAGPPAVVTPAASAGTSAGASAGMSPAPRAGPVAGRSPTARALAVLRAWDRARASAWARGDPAALAALYAPGSRAGAADVVMLRRWQARGLRVRGMRMQVLGAALRARAPGRLVFVVTDRLVGAVAVPGALPLPRDQPSTRRLDFRRVGERWLLAGVVPVSRG